MTTTSHKVRPKAARAVWLGNTSRIGEGLIIPAVLIAAWFIVTGFGFIDTLYLPSPEQFVDSFLDLMPRLPSAIIMTVGMTLTGFLIGTGLGILVGLLLAYSVRIRNLFGGVFEALRPVPVFSLIPLFILWFGLGTTAQVILVAFGTFVVLVVSTLEAIRNVSPIYIKAGLNLGASRSFLYRTVVVPSITPHLAGAVRVSAAASWGLGVAAEFIGAQDGLGYLMLNRQTFLDTAGILNLVVIYSLIALLFDFLIRSVQRRILRWTERDQMSSHVGSVLGVK
ncbi:ABC transporter permease [Arthrobacter sp. AB6]|uniref:ABC transporter permease n=1 Tax=Arthrobacter sp. AB6 TaxID=2962570 RepID=UPI0028816CCC|nr:ABC transporter permease [Arthrobacter sp. AB6]MDT0196476.1 ABC transporter permease [Arthrobacter sp. AB6]